MLAIGLLIALVLSPASFAQTAPIRIAVGEWPPYFSKDAEGYGTYAQVVRRAFELEGLEVQYGFFPWKRAFLETQEGRWPVSAGWGKTAERERYFHFCDPVLLQREQFFFSTDRPVTATRWQELEGLSFGIIEGAALGENLDRLVSGGKVTVYHQSTLEDLFHMLVVGRVDLVMGNENVARESISTALAPEEAEKLVPLDSIDVQWDYRVIVSKKAENGAQICDRFNAGLQRLRDSGEYDRLLWPDRSGGPGNNSPS